MHDPWIGPDYAHANVKLLVMGESRYDEDFSDRQVIELRINQKFPGRQRRTFTNFERAVLGQDYSESQAQNFWNATIFYNYNLSFFPGQPRMPLARRTREDPQNAKSLRRILHDLEPTHAIVWGIGNWSSVHTGSGWTDAFIPGTDERYSSLKVDTHATFFTGMTHPSTAFSSKKCTPILLRFLELRS